MVMMNFQNQKKIFTSKVNRNIHPFLCYIIMTQKKIKLRKKKEYIENQIYKNKEKRKKNKKYQAIKF